MAEPAGFDLHAAWLRRAEKDNKSFIEALAVRLEQSLPGHVQVERKKDSLFSRQVHVAKITVRTGGDCYILENSRGEIVVSQVKEVRGIVLSSREVELSDWIQNLDVELQNLSGHSAQAAGALRQFLMS
jgi:hypothetical protein